MSRFLFAWELGGGFGHLARFGPLVRLLVRQGHDVTVAAKDLVRAVSYFAGTAVRVLPTPRPLRRGNAAYPSPASFPQLLANAGFGSYSNLVAVVAAWRNLYQLVRPDLIVFDHSPQSLLASRCTEAKKVVIGSGFFCPPDEAPMPSLRPWTKVDPEQLARDEKAILAQLNRVLERFAAPALDHFASLYADVDETALTTFRELDHFPQRRNGRYWGAWTGSGGAIPEWPDVSGPRIFAYLKPFATLPQLLDAIAQSPASALVFIDGASREHTIDHSSPRIRFATTPLNVKQVSRECDAAILNGTHGTTVAMLLAGKPTLQIPTYLEQTLFARRVTQLGAGVATLVDQPQHFAPLLGRLLDDGGLRRGAEKFAERYVKFDPVRQAAALASHLATLAGAP